MVITYPDGEEVDLLFDRRLHSYKVGEEIVPSATKVLGVAGVGLEAKGFRAMLAGLKDGPDDDTPEFEFRKKAAALMKEHKRRDRRLAKGKTEVAGGTLTASDTVEAKD